MTFNFLLVIGLLIIVFTGCYGADLEEDYWKSVFPDNAMPKALRDILPPSDSLNDNMLENHADEHSVKDTINGYQNFYGYEDPSKEFNVPDSLNDKMLENHARGPSVKGIINGYQNFYGYEDPSKEFNVPKSLNDNMPEKHAGGHSVKDTINGYQNFYGYEDPSKEFNVPNSLNDNMQEKHAGGHSVKDVINGYQNFYGYEDPSKEFNVPNSDSLQENHGNTQLMNGEIASIDETIFFFEKDLRLGKLVNLPGLITTSDKTPFLPDRIVKSIPFSSAELPNILSHFSLKSGTREADNVNKTIRGCERVAITGEEKFCATSLESFVDLSVSKLGKQIKLLSTELSKETEKPLFRISRGMQNMGENQVVCHKMEYPSAVFLCHSIKKTTVYQVPLVGKDGINADALAVCHRDTLAWNPKHKAFQILKVKPGTVPICHFLTRDTLVWVSS